MSIGVDGRCPPLRACSVQLTRGWAACTLQRRVYTYVGGCAPAPAAAVGAGGAGGGGSTRAPGTYCPMNEPSSVKRPTHQN